MFQLTFVVLAIATFFLFFGAPENLSLIRSIKELWNLGHIVYFVLLTYLFNQWLWLSHQSVLRRWSVTLLMVLLLGVAIEILQYGSERTPDVADLSRNFVGALLVLTFAPTLSVLISPLWKTAARFVVSVIFILHLVPLSLALFDEAIARSSFPVLSSFETATELDRWKGGALIDRIQIDSEKQDFQLQVKLTTARFSGTGLQYFPGDWSEYAYVNLRFYQPLEEPLKLTVRIHDVLHNNQYNDRFNRNFEFEQGWSEIRIALAEVKSALAKREMDLTRVSDISFFSFRLPQPRELYLDRVYLSN